MVGNPKSDNETLVYVIAHEERGWRKVGVGFGHRLERWRRDGWTLEQQVLCPTRTQALDVEAAVKRVLRTFRFDELGLMPTGEGATEMWPSSWGTVDLTAVNQAVRDHSAALLNATMDLTISFLSHAGDAILEDPAYSVDERESVRRARADLNDVIAEDIRRQFVEQQDPEWTREDLERWGIDWATAVRARQDYWSARRAGGGSSVIRSGE